MNVSYIRVLTEISVPNWTHCAASNARSLGVVKTHAMEGYLYDRTDTTTTNGQSNLT